MSGGPSASGEGLFIFGGATAQGGLLRDAWVSKDGATFSELATPPWEARAFHATVVFNGKIWLLGGALGPANASAADPLLCSKELWSTIDAITWSQASPGGQPWAASGGRYGHTLTTSDSRMWLFGGFQGHTGGTFIMLNDLWWSNDPGNQWNYLESPDETTQGARVGASLFFAPVTDSNELLIYGGHPSVVSKEKWTDGVVSVCLKLKNHGF